MPTKNNCYTNTRLLLFLFLLIVLLLAGCSNSKKGNPEDVYTIYDKIDAIKSKLGDINYCDKDEDCVMLSGLGCPFGCITLLNKNENDTYNKIKEEVEVARSPKYSPIKCYYKCPGYFGDRGKLICLGKKCNTFANILLVYEEGGGGSVYEQRIAILNTREFYTQRKVYDTDRNEYITNTTYGRVSDLTKLTEMINKADVFSLNDSYKCERNCPTDIPYQNIQFMVNSTIIKEISTDMAGSKPGSLRNILAWIKDIESKLEGSTIMKKSGHS